MIYLIISNFQADIVLGYYKNFGWNTIIILGDYSNIFYMKLQSLGTLLVNNLEDNYYVENVVPYFANSVIMRCKNLEDFEKSLLKAIGLPNWHVHANIFVYYDSNNLTEDTIGLIFYAFWVQSVTNAIIIQKDENISSLYIWEYSPYITESYKLQHNMGCFTVNKYRSPLKTKIVKNVKCEESCDNVTITSVYRKKHLGTCIGFNKHIIPLGDVQEAMKLELFVAKSNNLHGFSMRSYAVNLPFMDIQDYSNGSSSLALRDGMIWNIMSQKLNFSIDLSVTKSRNFDFEETVARLMAYALRNIDLYLCSSYLADLLVIQLDFTFPFKESGVCILAHRAEYEANLFNLKIVKDNWPVLIEFGLCFVGVWLTFVIFSKIESNKLTIDLIGKEFVNSIRNVLSISLHRPPKRLSFRIFLTISTWCFFSINFSMHAAIVSFITAVKRVKEVETFNDILEKGYPIEGLASPDLVFTDNDDLFTKINDKMVPTKDFSECIERMSNSSHRFCLVDCAIGRYYEKHKLNSEGKQYLHITKDKIHNHYLNFVFPKDSHLSARFTKIITAMVEAGLIKKWEEYRYAKIKEESIFTAFSMNDFIGIFKGFWFLVVISSFVFILEIIICFSNNIWKHCSSLICYIYRKMRKYCRKIRNKLIRKKVKLVHESTQTIPE